MNVQMKYLILVALPLVFYPIYFATANLFDSLTGDQQLINWLVFDSRGDLFHVFLKDWFESLPIIYILYVSMLIPIRIILDYLAIKLLIVYCAIISVSGITIFILFGFPVYGVLVNTVALLLSSMIYFKIHK